MLRCILKNIQKYVIICFPNYAFSVKKILICFYVAFKQWLHEVKSPYTYLN
jgi:hypothetical protein